MPRGLLLEEFYFYRFKNSLEAGSFLPVTSPEAGVRGWAAARAVWARGGREPRPPVFLPRSQGGCGLLADEVPGVTVGVPALPCSRAGGACRLQRMRSCHTTRLATRRCRPPLRGAPVCGSRAVSLWKQRSAVPVRRGLQARPDGLLVGDPESCSVSRTWPAGTLRCRRGTAWLRTSSLTGQSSLRGSVA